MQIFSAPFLGFGGIVEPASPLFQTGGLGYAFRHAAEQKSRVPNTPGIGSPQRLQGCDLGLTLATE
jgi:hypothetical protein